MSDRLSLTTLQLMIRDSVVLAMPGSYWVTAEIAELKENYSGHCYLELIEKDKTNENIRARARATIWAARNRMLKVRFESSTGSSLSPGMKVLLKVTVEYHELYGLSLNISDIDPAYTMGEMALRRSEIINKLHADGIFDMNRELDFPAVPGRIAVISSASSAGYTDFCRQLRENAYGYIFSTELFNSPMQGDETEYGIVSALNQIADRVTDFDAVAILRGGGSVADLQWFDNYNIAYHITQFPLPVITGIGHDKDISVTDMVAWKSLKTPTATAAFLIEKMNDTDSAIAEMYEKLKILSEEIIRESASRTLDNARRVMPASSKLITETRRALGNSSVALSGSSTGYVKKTGIELAIRISDLKHISGKTVGERRNLIQQKEPTLRTAARTILSRMKDEVKSLETNIRLADPVNILKKGFTITEINGKAIKDISSLTQGDIINTRFHDGETESSVTGIKIKKQVV
ncbi:MAG: exodeoxyribonuclease VII large subunit [Bacteroidales bacterium]|nr:exodeoxyribonuclease VII large subunit [Bacteroidales bacterium]